MKKIILLLIILAAPLISQAANEILCSSYMGNIKLVRTDMMNNHSWFKIDITRDLSPQRPQDLVDYRVGQKKYKDSDIVTGWTGDTSVDLEMTKGFLDFEVGAKTDARLVIEKSNSKFGILDIIVDCEVTK